MHRNRIMLFNDSYRTISTPSEGIFTDRGSKFIGYAYPLSNEEEVKYLLAHIHAQHPKARHHCWAFRLTADRSVFRTNDDGEPAGSAGRPILNTLLSSDLTNILLVVVRYFGGTLLGIPGLIKAYKSAAASALDAASVIERTVNDIYRLEFDYIHLNEVMKVIKNGNIEIKEQQFDNSCIIEVAIRQSQVNQVMDKFSKMKMSSVEYRYSL